MANNRNSGENLEKLPPQNLDAEKSVLGSLMIEKDSIVRIVDFLQTKDFYKKIHQDIYETVIELFEKGEPIDLLSVSTRLKERAFRRSRRKCLFDGAG